MWTTKCCNYLFIRYEDRYDICSILMINIFLCFQTLIPLILGHTPAGASARQLVHYAQGITGKEFLRFDHGSSISNLREHGRIRPPAYDLGLITTPVFLHYSDSDPLAHVNDVDRLFRELGRPIGKFRIPMASFSHIDFIWGIDAKDLLYYRTINLIRSMDVNGFVNDSTWLKK